MNLKDMKNMRERLALFQQDHPKVLPFFNSIKDDGTRPGTIVELKVTSPEGRQSVMNIRLNENDVETLHMLMSQR